MKKTVVSTILFILCLLAYSPLALDIDTYANNATVTNAVWVLLDAIFPLFWSFFCIMWLGVAVYNVLRLR